jgi:hypothetical protein
MPKFMRQYFDLKDEELPEDESLTRYVHILERYAKCLS